MKKSLHILADFYGCAGDPMFFTHKRKVRAKTLQMIRRSGLKIIASRFHKFDPHAAGEGGVTGVVIVSESHLTVHTWPEKRFVNLDVFFCNYSRDNTKNVRAIFAEYRKIYRPERMRRREVWRD